MALLEKEPSNQLATRICFRRSGITAGDDQTGNSERSMSLMFAMGFGDVTRHCRADSKGCSLS